MNAIIGAGSVVLHDVEENHCSWKACKKAKGSRQRTNRKIKIMMVKYVILRANISGMGGAQMYVRNKSIYETSLGRKVFILYSQKGKILLEDLKVYKDTLFEDLNLPPCVYKPKDVSYILEKMLALIEYVQGDKIIIESNDVVMSLWGEILAEYTRGKNFVFLLNEQFSSDEKSHNDFFLHKYRRHELAGIQPVSLVRLFEGFYHIDKKDSHCLLAHCNNVVDDCYNPILEKISNQETNICSIGRLNKPYVYAMCNDVKTYVTNHAGEKFHFILIGDSPDERDVKNIEKIFSTVNNIHLSITGYMFPIPRNLFPLINVFISCAGSARASYREKRPTISIDANTFQAIGILGYDTESTIYAKEFDKPYKIVDALTLVLQDKVKPVYPDLPEFNMNLFDAHEIFWGKAANKMDYYPILNHDLTKREKYISLLVKMFGKRIMSRYVYPYGRKIRDYYYRSK